MLRFSILIIALLISFISNDSAYAANNDHQCSTGRGWCKENNRECRSYRQGNCGKRKGDWYGARRKVTSREDANEVFNAYFAGQNVTISDITEKPWRFEASVNNQNGELVDRVIIDKRSGRVRSIY